MVTWPLGVSAGSCEDRRRWRKDEFGLSSSFPLSWYLPVWKHFVTVFTHELKSISRSAVLGCGYQLMGKDPDHRKGIQISCKINIQS